MRFILVKVRHVHSLADAEEQDPFIGTHEPFLQIVLADLDLYLTRDRIHIRGKMEQTS